ncbi:MAG: hypothetical protein KBB94_08260 [Legionellaceae bacterium]|nr:hypothetical protein [Legionellaceae bacterium]MBP9775623.1 hypothetical protein [Legionellaceae bacterium]
MPDKIGADFNDVLREEGAQSVAKKLANPVDAKALLKSEIQAIKSKDNEHLAIDNTKKLHRINQDTIIGVDVNAKQTAQLKALDTNVRKQLNRIAESYKNDVITHNQTLNKTTAAYVQKELER